MVHPHRSRLRGIPMEIPGRDATHVEQQPKHHGHQWEPASRSDRIPGHRPAQYREKALAPWQEKLKQLIKPDDEQ